jgi:hypothetical protein
VDFGNVAINTSASRTVTLTVDSGYRYGGATGTGVAAPFGLGGGTCAASGGFTGPGTCTVSETFSPTSLALSSGTTTTSECPVGGGTCIPIPFTEEGTGVSAAGATPVAFGNVALNTTATRDVTLTLDAGYRFSGATGTGIAAPFDFAANTCGAGGGFVGPGTCGFRETFRPTALGPVSGSTIISECPTAGGTCISVPVPVQGTGTSVSSANPSPADFGSVPLGSNSRILVDVTLDVGYRFAGATGTGIAAPFAFEARTCASGFTGPGTCQVRETYTPTLVGPSSGTLTMSECPVAGGVCIPIAVHVQGVGASTFEARPAAIDFGNVRVGDSVKENVHLTIDPGYRISGGSGSGTVAPFALELKSCASATGPGGCTLRETFAPPSVGHATGTLTLTECPILGGTCVSIPVALAGTGVPNPT